MQKPAPVDATAPGSEETVTLVGEVAHVGRFRQVLREALAVDALLYGSHLGVRGLGIDYQPPVRRRDPPPVPRYAELNRKQARAQARRVGKKHMLKGCR